MSGLQLNDFASLPLLAISCTHADANEVFRRFVARDGTRCGAGEAAAGVARQRSTTVGDALTLDALGLIPVDTAAAIAAGDLIESAADGRATPWADPVSRHAVVDGAAANTDIAVAGILAADTLDSIVALDGSAVPGPVIHSDGHIRSSGATGGKKLLVVWHAPYRPPQGRALTAASGAGKTIIAAIGLA